MELAHGFTRILKEKNRNQKSEKANGNFYIFSVCSSDLFGVK